MSVTSLTNDTQSPKVVGLNIVLLGDFNPKIFQPAWFSSEKLLTKEEAERAEVDVIHPEVVSFRLDWLHLNVTRERVAASTSQEPFELLRDLVVGTFTLLRHTPLRQMGINTEMHFQVESEERWHQFGHLLAPKQVWDDLLKSPGMQTLVMEGLRPDVSKGFIRVFIEPSMRVHPGVYFKINDHYEVSNQSSVQGAREIIEILSNSWDDSLKRAKHIIDSLMRKL